MELEKLPEINRTYHFFDDGKIKPSRHYYITIDHIYQLDNVPSEIKHQIKEVQQECHWLYAKKTDYVVQGHKENDSDEIHWFIRTVNGGWFSIDSWWGGLLDVTGKIFNDACKRYAEMGFYDFAAACEE